MTKARKKLFWIFGIYFVVLVVYISSVWTQPIFDKLEPHIIGLPFVEFNIILVQILIAIGLGVFFVADMNLQKKESQMRKEGKTIEY